MTCREFTDFILDYLEEALEPSQKKRFEEHLAECPECRTFLGTYRSTGQLVRDAMTPDEPATAPRDLIEAILDSRRHTS